MGFELFNCAHLWALVVPGTPGAQGELSVPSSGQRDLQAERAQLLPPGHISFTVLYTRGCFICTGIPQGEGVCGTNLSWNQQSSALKQLQASQWHLQGQAPTPREQHLQEIP